MHYAESAEKMREPQVIEGACNEKTLIKPGFFNWSGQCLRGSPTVDDSIYHSIGRTTRTEGDYLLTPIWNENVTAQPWSKSCQQLERQHRR